MMVADMAGIKSSNNGIIINSGTIIQATRGLGAGHRGIGGITGGTGVGGGKSTSSLFSLTTS